MVRRRGRRTSRRMAAGVCGVSASASATSSGPTLLNCQGKRARSLATDHLPGPQPIVADDGAQRLVPGHDVVQGGVQGLPVERAGGGGASAMFECRGEAVVRGQVKNRHWRADPCGEAGRGRNHGACGDRTRHGCPPRTADPGAGTSNGPAPERRPGQGAPPARSHQLPRRPGRREPAGGVRGDHENEPGWVPGTHPGEALRRAGAPTISTRSRRLPGRRLLPRVEGRHIPGR